jgi:predicted SAM-dependent methyltransferase
VIVSPRRKLSLLRPITAYAKVQTWVGNAIRNRAFQLRKQRIRDLRYLDIGCGRNVHSGLINVDYLWHPNVDVCWDVTRNIPFPSGSMKGIFTEHCLEHFSLPVAFGILKECRRILIPNGVLRVVVPDAGVYLELYHRQKNGNATASFPFQENESFEGMFSPILSVNRVFYQDRNSAFGHRCMYDFQLLKLLLDRLGFESIRKVNFRQGCDPILLIDSESRECESLYVEAVAGSESLS